MSKSHYGNFANASAGMTQGIADPTGKVIQLWALFCNFLCSQVVFFGLFGFRFTIRNRLLKNLITWSGVIKCQSLITTILPMLQGPRRKD